MKKITPLPLLFFAILPLSLFAQTGNRASSLTGAWMEKTDSAQEIKLISPTHVFFFVKSPVNDSFYVAGAGTYSVSGNQYAENLQYGNFEVKGIKATYNYSVQDNQFKQQGTLVLSDGREVPINHTFRRIENAQQNTGRQIGTWNQLSSTFLNDSGQKVSHTNATHIRYQIITPTHWMRISLVNGKFENAFGGTYTTSGNKVIWNVDFSSIPAMLGATAELTQVFDGNKMTVSGPIKDAQGKKVNEIVDVFEQVGTK